MYFVVRKVSMSECRLSFVDMSVMPLSVNWYVCELHGQS